MPILPTKYIPVDFSTIGVGSLLIEMLAPNDTVSVLWDRVRDDPRVRTFDRYADALTLLFAAGIINFQSGVIIAVRPSRRETT
jgi:hypothetical protein